jgi:stalled ribosome alternative rescue factor ArfA
MSGSSGNIKTNKIAKMLRTPRFRQLVIKNKKRYNRKKNKNADY